MPAPDTDWSMYSRAELSIAVPANMLLPGRRPIRPGYFLETRYLKPLRISQDALSKAIGVSRRRINELVNGHRSITPDTAVRLAMFLKSDPRFWLQMQALWDAYEAWRQLRDEMAEAPV